MQKIIIAANNMIIGGIENSLLSLLNTIDYQKAEVTLLLQAKKGEFLDLLPKQVKILEYTPLIDGNIIKRKIINRFNYIKFIITNKNKFDCAICYASYIELPAKIIRKLSKNNYMWVHTDYTNIYEKVDFYKFIKTMNYKKYRNLVFVSEAAKQNYMKYCSSKKQKYLVCHNLLNIEDIKLQSEKIISYQKKELIFINVSRHDEPAKKISRLIEAVKILKEKKYEFKVLLIGDGQDHEYYKQLVSKYHLENWFDFLGSVKNPYPYYKIADCFILTSQYEGGPLTVYESLFLNTPVITTNVGDVKQYVTKQNGIIIDKTVDSLISAMIEFIDNKEQYKVNFDFKQYNLESKKIIEQIVGEIK